MKIIQAGTAPPERDQPTWWVGMVGQCARCGAKFQLEKTDAEKVTELGTPTRHAEVVCPTNGCKRIVWIQKYAIDPLPRANV